MELGGEDAVIWNDLSLAHRASNDLDRALLSMKRALELETHADLWMNFGSVLYLLGNYDDAADAFCEGLQLDKDAVFHVQESTVLKGDFVEAFRRLKVLQSQTRKQGAEQACAWLVLGGLAFAGFCAAVQHLVKFMVMQKPVSGRPAAHRILKKKRH
eukprot:SM000007S20915  [mRNA]  locus=s7:928168:929800:- [translate_table: standard]